MLVHKHPSILPRDFDIARDGTLDYRCDTEDNTQNGSSNNNPLGAASSNGPASVVGGGTSVGHRLSGSRPHSQPSLHHQQHSHSHHQSHHHHHHGRGDVLHGQQQGANYSGLQVGKETGVNFHIIKSIHGRFLQV